MASEKLKALLIGHLLKLPTPQVPPGTSPSGPYVGEPGPSAPIDFISTELVDVGLISGSPGNVPAPGRYLLCTCSAAEAEGMSVYVSARDSANDCPAVRKADPADAAKMPAIGQIRKLLGAAPGGSGYGCVVYVPGATEETGAGTYTVGAHYYIGSDALPCKSGDANVPAGGNVKQSIGIAISANLILRVPGLPSAATW
mgnify:FL=1